MLCMEEGSSPVSAITERRDMGLYEVPLSLFGFGVGTMLANFHIMCFQHAREECKVQNGLLCYTVPDIVLLVRLITRISQPT